VDILLDLQWWTSMVGIAIASATWVSFGQKFELELVTAAEEEFEKLRAQLLPGGGAAIELDKAVADDKAELLKRVREVQSRYANKPHDREYCLAAHVRSRLEDIDVTHSMADLELNAYEPGELLGSGSFGAVMMVKWLGRECALKKLMYSCTKEATTLSGFQHPHIVQFFRYWEASRSISRGSSSATTPLMTSVPQPKGRVSLKRSLTGSVPDAQTALSQDVAIDVMLQLAKAMWHLNSKNVAHRDLKPSNVLVRPVSSEHAPELAKQGYLRLKLGDFGLAKTRAQSSAYSGQTGNVGTRTYAAPEVFNEEIISKKRFPRKADVWSFGIMFSETMTGRPPFLGILRDAMNDKIKDGARPELPRACPEYLKFIIERSWKYKQEDRPNFLDLWKMMRYAQVRSLGLIRDDHQLFTFTTHEGVVQRLHKLPPREKPNRTEPNSFWLLLRRLTFLLARRSSMPQLDDKPITYMVNEVGAPETGASTSNTLDVIFFDGNVGERKFLSCKDTWVQRGKPNVWWPRDWLFKDFKGEIRVLVLQYDISEKEKGVEGKGVEKKGVEKKGVENVVHELQRFLVFSGQWNRNNKWDRPIVLVGHSLGCVVIEHLVVALNQKATSIASVKDEFDGNRAKVAKAFLASLAGCFFYAPPCSGLFPLESTLKSVFGGLTYSRELFADLCLDSSRPRELSEQFMLARSERVQLMALIEGSHTHGRPVVPASSMQEFKGKVEELEDSDHGNTCKPTSKDHPAYRRLVDFIRAIQNEGNVMQH
jgi:serine/threonine protein kinase